MKQIRLLMGLIVVVVLVSGCTALNGIIGGNRGDIGSPIPDYAISGTVTFYDTGIPMKATVKIGDRMYTTEHDGVFSLILPGNTTYDWSVSTLLTPVYGKINLTQDTVLNVEIPTFLGWSKKRFNELLITEAANAVVRWKDGTTIRYWIETPAEDSLITWNHYNLAKETIMEYQSLLTPVIAFEPVTDKDAAHLVFQWDTRESIDGYAGMCTRTWDFKNELTKGIVTIAYRVGSIDTSLNKGLMRHEIGHCVGLNHASDETFNMYPTVTPQNQELTLVEKYMLKLMYSIQPGTRPLNGTYGDVRTASDSHRVTYNDDGTVSEWLYTSVIE